VSRVKLGKTGWGRITQKNCGGPVAKKRVGVSKVGVSNKLSNKPKL